MNLSILSTLLSLTFACVGAVLRPDCATANEFVLFDAETAVTAPPMVLFDGAPRKTREAAVELATYIEKSVAHDRS